jgi:HAE1 family hydrophobic/amphiphilic exporter-1
VIRLTQLAVAKRSVTLLITMGLLLGGLFSWAQLKQEFLPDIDFPFVVVITPMPGASAQDVSTQVTEPIERSIASVPRLKHVDSSSVNSISIVVASFAYGTDVKETKATVDTNVKALALGAESQVSSFNINSLPPLMVAITATGDTTDDELNAYAMKTLVPSLQGLDGVASVDVTGSVEKRLMISLDPARLSADGVSLKQIQGILVANNWILPAGSMPSAGDISIPVSAQHQFTSLEEIQDLVVAYKAPAATQSPAPGSSAAPAKSTPIKISDLGTVAAVAAQPTGYAQIDGKPSLVISITKSSDANTVSVVQAVKDRLAQLQNDQASTFAVTTVEDLSTFIIESRDGLVREGGLGAIFAIITIFIFLLSLRSTLVAAVSIPVSILTALTVMLVAGVSINIMTLGGLAVAVGRVVDDAIVVLENIYRHRGRGDPMRVAVISGTREVASAITSSTLTTVAVFLPLGFIGGLVSQFFLPFALTVTFALLASLICALTVVPVLATLFIDRIKLDPDEGPRHHETIVQRIYTPLLRAALRNRRSRWSVLGIAGVLVVLTALLIPHIPTQFLNAGSEKYLLITVAPPSGTPSAKVLERAMLVEQALHAYPEINLVETTVPGDADTGLSALAAAFTGRSGNSATILARLNKSADLDEEQRKISDRIKSSPEYLALEAQGWSVEVAQQSMTGSVAISVVVSGTRPEDVAAATTQIIDALRQQPDLINVKSDLSVKADEIQVSVNPNEAIAYGLTTVGVQEEIHNALVGTKVGTISLADGPTDLYIKVNLEGLNSVDALSKMKVGLAGVQLDKIATVAQVKTSARVTRVDQSTAATISADTTSKDTGGVSAEIQKVIDELKAEGKLNGVTATLSGITEQMNEAFGGMYVSMAVAILLVYIVMVLVFNSLIDPLVIMFSLPLATIGAFPALFLTQRAMGISALIGFLMLIGIVVTNAIVLLDLVEQHRRRGMPMYEALMQGGRTRVRPILMTAIATILALMPLAMGLSEGTIIASELATVVIGGLFTSTFLTLIVVPVVYSLVEDGKIRVRGWFGLGPEHEEHAEHAAG